VWKPQPSEISNRLGWLNAPELMRERVAELEVFAKHTKVQAERMDDEANSYRKFAVLFSITIQVCDANTRLNPELQPPASSEAFALSDAA
jgi:hypothetical protein